MRYIDVKKTAVERLTAAGVPDADIDAQLMLIACTGLERSRLFTVIFEEMPEESRQTLESMLERRLKREPLQYILGSQEFMGHVFIVTPDVLIPRQDTELLTDKAIEAAGNELVKKSRSCGAADTSLNILDLCTGSGCVAISTALGIDEILREYEECGHKISAKVSVTASDISEGALRVAEKNSAINRPERVTISMLQSDLFENITGSYDIITANPPYVKAGSIPVLMPEVNVYEPRLALDGGADGLVFYRRIINEAVGYLVNNGRLIMEIDDDQGEAVSELMRGAGFEAVTVYNDLTGASRVVGGRLNV